MIVKPHYIKLCYCNATVTTKPYSFKHKKGKTLYHCLICGEPLKCPARRKYPNYCHRHFPRPHLKNKPKKEYHPKLVNCSNCQQPFMSSVRRQRSHKKRTQHCPKCYPKYSSYVRKVRFYFFQIQNYKKRTYKEIAQ